VVVTAVAAAAAAAVTVAVKRIDDTGFNAKREAKASLFLRTSMQRQVLLPAVSSPRTPPEQTSSARNVLFVIELLEGNKTDVPSERLNDGSGGVQAADTFIAIGKTAGVVEREIANRRIAKGLIRLPLQVTHWAPDVADAGAAA
jgi:hypothetical protein